MSTPVDTWHPTGSGSYGFPDKSRSAPSRIHHHPPFFRRPVFALHAVRVPPSAVRMRFQLPSDSMPSRNVHKSAVLDGCFPRFCENPRFRVMAHETTETAVRIDVPPNTRRQMKTCRPSFFGANQPHRSPHACNVRMIIASHHRAYRLATYTGIASWFHANGMRRFAWASSKPPDQPPHRGHADEDIAVRHACPPPSPNEPIIGGMRTPVMSERRCQHGTTGCLHCRHMRTQRRHGLLPPRVRPAVSARRGLDTLLENAPITPCLLSGDTSENIGLSGFFAFAVSAWTAAMPSSCVGNGGRPCIIAWTGRHGRVR